MDFITVLDYEHLDNGMFLTAFAKSLSQHKNGGIILHGDSEYTERLIQTGMMRKDATRRAIKDLNHRLVALLADQGIPVIAINGYQKSLITITGQGISIDRFQFRSFPSQLIVLISNLVLDKTENQQTPAPLSDVAYALKKALEIETITIFSSHEAGQVIDEDLPEQVTPAELNTDFREKYIPKSFRDVSYKVNLASVQNFRLA